MHCGAFGFFQRLAGALVLLLSLFVASVSPSVAQPIRQDEQPAGIDPHDDRGPVDQRVLVIHDSIALGAREQISAAFSNSEVNYLGFVGFRADVAADLLAQQTELISDNVAVELGSNYQSRTRFRSDIDQLMSLLVDVDHVTWLTPPRFRPGMDAITAEILAASRRYPNLQFVHWGAISDADPSLTWGDGIHLRSEGAMAMAELLRSHHEGDLPWNRIPIGSITGVRDGRRAVTLTGWAFDPDVGRRSTIRVTANGRRIASQKTNQARGAVARNLDTDIVKLGYSVRLTLPDGEHRLCVEVDNFDGLALVQTDCRTVVLSHAPYGKFEREVANGRSTIVRGWAIDPDIDGPVTVEVRRNRARGRVIASEVADRKHDGLAKAGKSPNHGFAIKIPSEVDDYCVVARNEFAGTDFTVLGCS